jgi:methyl-accepting chemotaxis protein
MNLRAINLAPRAAICFGVITTLLIGLGAFSYTQILHLRSAEQDIELNSLPSIQAVADVQIALLVARLQSVRMLNSTDPESHRLAQSKIMDAIRTLKERSDYYGKYLISGERDQAQYAQANAAMGEYIGGLNTLFELEASNHSKAVEFSNIEQVKRGNTYQEALDVMRAQNAKDAVASGKEAGDIYEHSVYVLISVLGSALVLTVFLSIAFTRSIVGPMNDSLKLAESIATGDLTCPLLVTGADEASRLMQALNAMMDNLRATIREISGAADQVGTAAVAMTSITEIADRTLQIQNSEIEQAAAAVNEMSAAVEEVARNATSTSVAAKHSSVSAELGNNRVIETLTAMESLTSLVEVSASQVQTLASQAQDIGKVLSVIRSVAEQTNLLALNAAIEAARAGEQGRGFAVVADEVRALAHRTQTSTEEIEQMIATIQIGSAAAVESMLKSTSEVYSTRQTAEYAGASLQEINASVLEINDRNLQIATASEEQANVARDVDRSLISIRNLAIKSSEGTRHTLIASNELSRLAVNLNELVLRFKT